MAKLINIYSDESCHLETVFPENNRFMTIGAISCPDSEKKNICQKLKEIKRSNNIMYSEVKWTKVSNKKLDAYEKLISYFFDCCDLNFRAIIIDKTKLRHNDFNHTHNDFYYKMYWQMLEWFIDPNNQYRMFIDIKDTQGGIKAKSLREVLCHSKYDFNYDIIRKIQIVRSHEIVLMQLVDIIIGVISYINNNQDNGTSKAKQRLVECVKNFSKLSLTKSTPLGAKKFNLFFWEGGK